MQKNRPLDVTELQGTYTALITPMQRGDGLKNPIDYAKLYRLIEDQEAAGIQGVVVAGTTGQSATLSHKEHAIFVNTIYKHVADRYPQLQFIVGAGSNCTNEAISLSKEIENKIGPSTFLHVTGYYNNPPQEGLIAHYNMLAKAIPKSNIILYNVPGRTSSKIEPETVMTLIDHVENIIGIKEASGDLEAVKRIIAYTNPDRFRVVSGEDHLVAEIIKEGGTGVISASANIAPKYFVEITKAALAGDHQEARRLQEEILPLVKQGVFYKKNPIPLAEMFNTELRLPLVRLSGIRPNLEKLLMEYPSDKLGINVKDYSMNS